LFFLKISDKIKVLILGVLFSILINFVIIPSYAKIAQQPIKEAALIAKNNNLKVVMYGLNMPSFMVYFQRKVEKRVPKVGDFVITKINKLKHIKKYSVIYSKSGIYLIKVEK